MVRFFGTKTTAIEQAYRVWTRLPRSIRAHAAALGARAARARLQNRAGPVRLVLFVTNRCTRTCRYCLYSSHLNDPAIQELAIEEFERLARSLPERLHLLTFTGGEPLVREDLPAIARAFWRFNRTRKISIVTNGDLPERAEAVVREILQQTRVTLDLQVSVQSCDDLAIGSPVADTLDRFVSLARSHRRIGLVAALTTISQDNLPGFPDLMDTLARDWPVLHKYQFVRGVPGMVFPVGPARTSDLTPPDLAHLSLDLQEQARVIDLVRSRLPHNRHPFMTWSELVQLEFAREIQATGRAIFPCRAGQVDCVVFEDGRLSLCENLEPVLSLRDLGMDLGKAWRSGPFQAAVRRAEGCACTHPCNLSTSMVFDRAGLDPLLVAGPDRPGER